jgi:DNA-binding MarR family transcriptional regulator
VRSLEQNRWIRRRPDPNDARAMLIEPTRKTLNGLGRFFNVADRLMAEAYAGFAERDAIQMVAYLARARRNLYEAAGKPDIRPQVML